MKTLALLASFGAIGLGACAKTDSEDLLTHGMSAAMEAKATGDGTTVVSATLFVGDPSSLNFVELQGDDALIASNSGVQVEMQQEELGNIVGHTATFTTDEEGDEFLVDFERSLDAGAPNSSVSLPAKFELTAQAPTSQSRAADLVLEWDEPADDDMQWTAEGGCIQAAGGTIDDGETSLTIAANTIVVVPGGDTSCQVTLTLSRQRVGDLDPGFGHGGSIVGTQERTTVFTSAP